MKNQKIVKHISLKKTKLILVYSHEIDIAEMNNFIWHPTSWTEAIYSLLFVSLCLHNVLLGYDSSNNWLNFGIDPGNLLILPDRTYLFLSFL